MTIGGVAIYWYKSRSNHHPNSKYWHMLFHLFVQSAWCTHILSEAPRNVRCRHIRSHPLGH